MGDEQTDEQVAQALMRRLGEHLPYPCWQIRRIVWRYGPRRARRWAKEAERIYDAGGALTPQGIERTLGGVFFVLVKRQLRKRARLRLFRPGRHWRRRQPPPRPQLPPLAWVERTALFAPILEQRGALEHVKITLIGRPGEVRVFRDCVVTTMPPPRGPSLPRGLPPLPEATKPYAIYISGYHWKRVAEQLADPDQVLVIEGWAAFDAELGALAVYAMHVSAQQSQAAKKRQGAEQ
jgi:PHAX RNA-binding domain